MEFIKHKKGYEPFAIANVRKLFGWEKQIISIGNIYYCQIENEYLFTLNERIISLNEKDLIELSIKIRELNKGIKNG